MRSKKVVSFLLAAVLAFGCVQPSQAATISSAKKEEQRLKDQKRKAEEEKRALTVKLNKIIVDMKQAQADVTAKEDEIVAAEDKLIEAKIEEDDQYESMKIRIKYMYENGDVSLLAVFFSAEDMSDFLNKAEYVEQISSYDREMLVKFQKVVKNVEKKEAELRKERKQLVTLQNNLGKKQKEVKSLLASKKIEISNLDTAIGENAKELQRLIREAEAAKRRQEEAANNFNNSSNSGNSGSTGGSGGSGGGSPRPPHVSGSGFLTNPCPAARISSEFGPRRAPVAGASTFHKGRDYAAARGSAIYAGAEGRVVEASYNSFRGNYVVINHGNGIQTWYQHMTSTYVSYGQKVGKGQNIGTVGNTGISSGPHLHFEVHVNGVAVDPRKYL